MTTSNRIARGTAMVVACVILGLVLLPLASVWLAASFETWRHRGQDNYSTSVVLVEAARARAAPSGIILTERPAPRSANCDADADRLPQWTNGEDRFWAAWGPFDAFVKTRAILSSHSDLLNGSKAVQTRYVEDHTSELERRFLLGCISGTLMAPVCASRVQSLLSAADERAPPLDLQQRTIDLQLWNEKTLCALARGLSAHEVTVSAQQRQPR